MPKRFRPPSASQPKAKPPAATAPAAKPPAASSPAATHPMDTSSPREITPRLTSPTLITPADTREATPASGVAERVPALVIFAANVNPVTEPFLIDRVAAIAGSQEVPVIICLNKTDLDPAEDLGRIYERAGFSVIRTSAETGAGVEALRAALAGKLTAFTGNSGVGKSSVLNRLSPDLGLQTGTVSEKLGRGRHTTRHVELYALDEDTYVADTPGFSSFDTDQMELILK